MFSVLKAKNPFYRGADCKKMIKHYKTDQTHKKRPWWVVLHGWVCEHYCSSVFNRSGGFLSKILKKRPHKEAQTPDNGELTLAQVLSERTAGGEGKEYTKTCV